MIIQNDTISSYVATLVKLIIHRSIIRRDCKDFQTKTVTIIANQCNSIYVEGQKKGSEECIITLPPYHCKSEEAIQSEIRIRKREMLGFLIVA